MSVRIDAHHHFWKYSPEEYGWISDDMKSIRKDFLPNDLHQEITSAGIDGVISVQARQSLEETEWLLELAYEHDFISGVVGWVPLTDPGVEETLEGLTVHSKLKGIRHIVQAEPDGYMLREDFNAGVRSLAPNKLAYDVLVHERQLPEAIQFIDKHPKQMFVLDHIAKPRIRDREMSPWRENIHELAKRENVFCKISGLVTEADSRHWTAADLAPYFDVVLSSFRPERLMFGSDWPVCLPACSYRKWIEAVSSLIAALSLDEQDLILGNVACKAYGLSF
jgi:L-fuconolactonase